MPLILLLWSAASLFFGVAVIQLVLALGALTVLHPLFGDGFPQGASAIAVLLALELAAAVVGAFAAVGSAPGRPGLHAALFAIVVAGVNAAVVFAAGSPWPVGPGLFVVASAPLPIWLGYRLALRVRWRPDPAGQARRTAAPPAALALALVAAGAGACAAPGESPDDPVMVVNETAAPIVVIAMTPEAAARYDPALSFELAPDDDRLVPPGGAREMAEMHYEGYRPGTDLFLFVYTVRDGVAGLAGTRAVTAAEIEAAGDRVVIDQLDGA